MDRLSAAINSPSKFKPLLGLFLDKQVRLLLGQNEAVRLLPIILKLAGLNLTKYSGQDSFAGLSPLPGILSTICRSSNKYMHN